MQGGLEYPCKVSVTMPGTVSNLLVLEKYWQLVEELYTEPKNEEILGSFLHAIVADQRPPPTKKNTKIKKAIPSNVPEHKDIRSFLEGSSFLVKDAQKYLQHHYKLILVEVLVFRLR